jgi:predicted NodU family carbamoyl transferase
MQHHDTHAVGAFFRSGFDNALIYVTDGAGSLHWHEHYEYKDYPEVSHLLDSEGRDENGNDFIKIDRCEVTSISTFDRTNGFESLFKAYNAHDRTRTKTVKPLEDIRKQKYLESIKNNKFNIDHLTTRTLSPGFIYQMFAQHFYGMTAFDSGKIMGLSSYGRPNASIKRVFDENGFHPEEINNYCHSSTDPLTSVAEEQAKLGPELQWAGGYFNRTKVTQLSFPIELLWSDYKKIDGWQNDPCITPQEYKDFAYMIQSCVQEKVYNDIKKYLVKSGKTNLVLSGGFFHNVVANYYIRKKLDEDFGFGKIKMFADPICSDSGNSHGTAILSMLQEGLIGEADLLNETFKIDNLYLGRNVAIDEQSIMQAVEKYKDLTSQGSIEYNDTTYEEVANLINENNIVALYQGRAEVGPRALGNRSILYNPTDVNGKDKVNIVKKREWFRPFAASVLYEETSEWFDMGSLDESPFMMYAVDTLKNKQELIPAVVHVDGTCRVQTVKQEQNENYYKLINEFYNQTGIPMLLNTSFNLAGDTMVQDIDDAIRTLCESEIEYLFLPELMKLVKCTKLFEIDKL